MILIYIDRKEDKMRRTSRKSNAKKWTLIALILLTIIAIIATTLFAPIVEELIYRKSLQDCFKNKKLFIIISGLIFGLIHVIGSPNPLDYLFIISYGLFGACFAKILVETDNVYSTIMVHMFHNGILSILAIVVKLL